MARRIPIALVVLSLLMTEAVLAQTNPSSILVQYSFDDGTLDTGPDTFSVFQNAKGSVRLTTSNRLSGYRSIEIQDVAGDHDFPELQGYFPLRTHGKLFLHFAFMATNPAEELNIALAGPEWFSLRPNGIGFWLKTIDGYLCQYSDSMPKKLFPITPFVWYVVNATYDIDSGTYDLVIHQEGQADPVVSLQQQKNAANQPGSTIDKFSFIGDPGTDQSNVVYYVDDVILGVDESITQLPFAAPGRRKLFVDYWDDYQRGLRSQPSLLPVVDFSDLGIRPQDIRSMRNEGLWEVLQKLLAGQPSRIPESASYENRRLLEGVALWSAGTAAFNQGNKALARSRFDEASRTVPSGKIYAMNAIMSLAALGQWTEVDTRLNSIYSDWRYDVRYPAAAALIGLARHDLAHAEQWLYGQPLLADQYFYVLLWQKQFARASQFAERMLASNPALWHERLGDAAFMSGDFGTALRRYEQVPDETRVLLKLSDVYFRLGDLQKERMYRERIYGQLAR